jgi:hypothetical protein
MAELTTRDGLPCGSGLAVDAIIAKCRKSGGLSAIYLYARNSLRTASYEGSEQTKLARI